MGWDGGRERSKGCARCFSRSSHACLGAGRQGDRQGAVFAGAHAPLAAVQWLAAPMRAPPSRVGRGGPRSRPTPRRGNAARASGCCSWGRPAAGRGPTEGVVQLSGSRMAAKCDCLAALLNRPLVSPSGSMRGNTVSCAGCTQAQQGPLKKAAPLRAAGLPGVACAATGPTWLRERQAAAAAGCSSPCPPPPQQSPRGWRSWHRRNGPAPPWSRSQ